MNERSIVEYLQGVLDEVAYLAVEPDQPLLIDSLIAAQLKWRVDLDLDVDLPFEEYLVGPTLQELAALIQSKASASSSELETST